MNTTTDKEQKESIKIEEQVNIELNNLSVSELETPHNPLYNVKVLDTDRTKQVGTISAISGQDGIMELMYSYLELTDVVQLERTCKRYVNVERTRRIAIGNALGLEVGRDPLDHALINYINNTSDSSTVSLQKFLLKIKPHRVKIESIGFIIFYVYKMTMSLDPLSFEVFLESTFSNSSLHDTNVLLGMIDMKFSSRRAFQIAKHLLRGDNNVCGILKRKLLGRIRFELEDENERGDNDFSERFFLYSMDLEVMRVLISIEGDGDDGHPEELHLLKDFALLVLNKTIMIKGVARRQGMTKDDPIFLQIIAFNSLFNKHIPKSFPGMVDGDDNLSVRDSIKQYWVDDPSMIQIWKVALFKALKWVYELEIEGRLSDYLLISRIIQGEEIIKLPNSPINNFSLAAFLIMKSVDCAGAVSMSVRLESKEGLTDLFCDYYEFLRLYEKGFRELKELSERMLATHSAAIAAVNHAAAQP